MEKRCFFFYFIFVCVLAGSCQLLDSDDKEAKKAAILNNPSLAGITDSLSRFPDDAGLHLRRGELLSQQNQHDLAYADYKKAWELKPDETNAIAYTSNLFITGKVEEAISILRHCASEFPENTEFARRLSETYMQTGQSRKALEQYDAILKADSNNFEAWYEKGILLAGLKDTTGAITALERAYVLQPLQLFGISLANLYAETKDPRVLPLCNELIEKNGMQENVDILFVKGIYFTNIDDRKKALEQFELCIKHDWKFTEAYIEKGIIFYNQKNFDEALKTFALAAKVSNTYADAYYWMGRSFESIGKLNEARDNYERALALDKQFEEAKLALKRLKNS
ncbi:MAG: tetratricopeptide repeat protein [Chitinophagaceae bacterium]